METPENELVLPEVDTELPEVSTQLDKSQEELGAEARKQEAMIQYVAYLKRFSEGELTFEEYQGLSRTMKARFRQVMRASGKTHINGRPLADFEVAAGAKRKEASKKARKAARASRRRNRQGK